MAMEMNRRTFLKTTAAAAAAVSMTGLLGGCGSGAQPLAVVKLPAFEVALMGVTVKGGNVYDTNKENLSVDAVFSLTYTGTGFNGDSYGNIFGASVADTALDLRKGGNLAVADFPFSRGKSCTVAFYKEAAGINTAYANGEPVKLTVKLAGTTAEFTYDGNQKAEGHIAGQA